MLMLLLHADAVASPTLMLPWLPPLIAFIDISPLSLYFFFFFFFSMVCR